MTASLLKTIPSVATLICVSGLLAAAFVISWSVFSVEPLARQSPQCRDVPVQDRALVPAGADIVKLFKRGSVLWHPDDDWESVYLRAAGSRDEWEVQFGFESLIDMMSISRDARARIAELAQSDDALTKYWALRASLLRSFTEVRNVAEAGVADRHPAVRLASFAYLGEHDSWRWRSYRSLMDVACGKSEWSTIARELLNESRLRFTRQLLWTVVLSRNADCRKFAVGVLSDREMGPTGRAGMWLGLFDRSIGVRQVCIENLYVHSLSPAFETRLLAGLLRGHRQPSIRVSAAGGLGHYIKLENSAVYFLATGLSDRDRRVRDRCWGVLTRELYGSERNSLVVPLLLAYLPSSPLGKSQIGLLLLKVVSHNLRGWNVSARSHRALQDGSSADLVRSGRQHVGQE